jgi:hypothetical protein
VIGRVVVDAIKGFETEMTRKFRWRTPNGRGFKEALRPKNDKPKDLDGMKLASAYYLKATSFIGGVLVEPKL